MTGTSIDPLLTGTSTDPLLIGTTTDPHVTYFYDSPCTADWGQAYFMTHPLKVVELVALPWSHVSNQAGCCTAEDILELLHMQT